MRKMNDYEVNDFQLRHDDVLSRIHQFENIVRAYGYSQDPLFHQTNPGYKRLIPPWGIAVPDVTYGNVVIFPDARGILRYTADVPISIATEISKPEYRSPTGGNFWDDFANTLEAARDTLLLGLGLMAVIFIFKK